ncbi:MULTISPECIES: CsbD family protein [unclassified Streptomyces]|uniref:CsbD family protein n=1 Tax=unclassified Streptomyces TaxID=2593676 RepID=UPI0035D93FA9
MADKAKGKMQQLKGKGKETVGKATGNDRMKAEGKIDQAKGKAKETMGEAQDRARGVDDSLRGRK